MVGNPGTLMSMRLVRSKLRKREESSVTADGTPQAPPPPPIISIETITLTNVNNAANANGLEAAQQSRRASIANGHIYGNGQLQQQQQQRHEHHERRVEFNIIERPEREVTTFVRTSGVAPTANNNLQNNSWVFPPKAPTPHIYNCMNDVLLSTANEKNGFKGFRKQFSGRFKRLVSKKNEPAPAIPPELKPQLKTIYVY